ncbi:hypothetical protein COO60DRAFT_1625641 [Scenedesmus sp. NREL 46B-D3]|nr:hypothetical protein COO60DRAFT_1625641 [Scenedesmus sp. NREL 46B-D3]
MQQHHCNIIGSRSRMHARLARSGCWPAPRSRAASTRCYASTSSPFKIKLMNPVKVADADRRPLLVFLPGTDGTGQAIMPQLPGLLGAGYDVRTLYIPPDDRSGWEQLQAQTLYLISTALGSRPSGPDNVQVTIVAESFGGCLALRLAAAAPQLVKALVLVNPATCYNQSLSGLSSFVSATNLLGLFPQDLYNTAQCFSWAGDLQQLRDEVALQWRIVHLTHAVLLPFLVDIDRVGGDGAQALRSMIFMDPPPDYETPATLQVASFDDREEDASALTIAAERRRLQLNSSAAFTTAGPQSSTTGPLAAGSSSGRRVGSSGKSRGRVTAAAAAAGLFNTAAGGAGAGRGSVFAPAAAANFRSNLMRSGNLRDESLRGLEVPCLLITSAKDRMLPSIVEALQNAHACEGPRRGARLARLLPRSRRVILPDSGHAALLERGMDLAAVMRSSGIVPTSDLVSPVLLGQEHLPGLVGSGRPLLFVGNHQKCGLYDMPLLAYELYLRGFKVKGLAHPGHWSGPLGPFFEQFGAVKAGPMTAFKLLKDGEQVLLFPGGAREVNKRVGDEYKLFWKDSPDFVRLAARCGAIIVPFAAVGADDAYDVLMDVDEVLGAPLLGDLGALKRVDPSLVPSEAVLPLTRLPGLGLPSLVPVPNLQRLYFKVCAPVDTAALGLGARKDAEAWQELYDGIKATAVHVLQRSEAARTFVHVAVGMPNLTGGNYRCLARSIS